MSDILRLHAKEYQLLFSKVLAPQQLLSGNASHENNKGHVYVPSRLHTFFSQVFGRFSEMQDLRGLISGPRETKLWCGPHRCENTVLPVSSVMMDGNQLCCYCCSAKTCMHKCDVWNFSMDPEQKFVNAKTKLGLLAKQAQNSTGVCTKRYYRPYTDITLP